MGTNFIQSYRTIIGDGPMMESVLAHNVPESVFNHPISNGISIHVISSQPLNKVQIYKIQHTLLQDVLYGEYSLEELNYIISEYKDRDNHDQ